jgi:hypothetical protein
MTKLRKLKIFPLTDEKDFENLCLALWKRILGDPNAQLNGRRGQSQQGVDLFGRRRGSSAWVGVQCKVRSNGQLTEKDVNDDLKAARSFNPMLSELVFATTAPRDEKIQEHARILTEQNARDGIGLEVSIVSWDDIQLVLSEESNLDICRRFYGDFFINYESLGIAISRVLSISIGVGRTVDTGYHLMIGKTPSPDDPNSYSGLDYWKGNYFIANWTERTMDTFPLKVFPSDLGQVFQFKRDAFIIAKWLREIKNIDDLIYGEDDDHVMLISNEEYLEYLDSQ